MQARFIRAAERDMADAVVFYNAARTNLGKEFARAVREAVVRIVERPLAWPVASKQCRFCMTYRFPYSIIYRVADDEIQIVAVAHHSRAPRFWEERLTE